jgi:hypothetical protein
LITKTVFSILLAVEDGGNVIEMIEGDGNLSEKAVLG